MVWLAGPFIGLGPQLNTWAECCRCLTLILLLFQLHLVIEQIVKNIYIYFYALLFLFDIYCLLIIDCQF